MLPVILLLYLTVPLGLQLMTTTHRQAELTTLYERRLADLLELTTQWTDLLHQTRLYLAASQVPIHTVEVRYLDSSVPRTAELELVSHDAAVSLNVPVKIDGIYPAPSPAVTGGSRKYFGMRRSWTSSGWKPLKIAPAVISTYGYTISMTAGLCFLLVRIVKFLLRSHLRRVRLDLSPTSSSFAVPLLAQGTNKQTDMEAAIPEFVAPLPARIKVDLTKKPRVRSVSPSLPPQVTEKSLTSVPLATVGSVPSSWPPRPLEGSSVSVSPTPVSEGNYLEAKSPSPSWPLQSVEGTSTSILPITRGNHLKARPPRARSVSPPLPLKSIDRTCVSPAPIAKQSYLELDEPPIRPILHSRQPPFTDNYLPSVPPTPIVEEKYTATVPYIVNGASKPSCTPGSYSVDTRQADVSFDNPGPIRYGPSVIGAWTAKRAAYEEELAIALENNTMLPDPETYMKRDHHGKTVNPL